MSAGATTLTFFPWQGTKSTVGTWTRNTVSLELGMGHHQSGGTQNEEATWDVWLDSGTWKIAIIGVTQDVNGIYTLQFNGVSQGTIDGYSVALSRNVYTELTGLVVAAQAVKTFQALMATKNASASNYYGFLQSCSFVRTGA